MRMKTLIACHDVLIPSLLYPTVTSLGARGPQDGRRARSRDVRRTGECSLIVSGWMMPDRAELGFCSRFRTATRKPLLP
jgi:hypothetical protein